MSDIMAHVQDRGNGSYLLVHSMGYDKKGDKIRKTRTVKAKNKTEANKMLAIFVAEIEGGTYFTPSKLFFADYATFWRDNVKKRVAPQTIETYDYILNNRILTEFGHLKVADISHVYLSHFLNRLGGEKLASSTIQKHFNVLNSIFKLAVKNEILKQNPMDKVDKPTVSYKEGDVYDSVELKMLYQLLNEQDNKQMVLLIKLALQTGMRKGEMLGLQWNDIDFKNNTINVRHSLSYTKDSQYVLKEPKTKRSVRKVAPPKKMMEELKQHKITKDSERERADNLWQNGKYDFVFATEGGKPFFPDAPNRWWTRFLKRTGFKVIRFHDLRHTAATYLINKGANIHSISKRLGHSNISTTMNIYGHYLEEADQKIAQLLDDDYI